MLEFKHQFSELYGHIKNELQIYIVDKVNFMD